MNSTLKYTIGTAEVIAFVVGTLMLMGFSRLFFNEYFFATDMQRYVVVTVFITVMSTLFGPYCGGLAGFLGVVSSSSVCGMPVIFGDAFAFLLLGVMIGQFSHIYYIREGRFKLRELAIWYLVYAVTIISIFVFIKPFVDFIVHNNDMFIAVKFGSRLCMICGIPVGCGLAVLFFCIGQITKYVKKT